ncbi:putative multidrug resistance ABC transporter [Melanomma pulvis-pyrius CBS 109.77]|uniref:Putative multidrug resistance ABC transporter n=1 Tax=Melanomma pulvis-pyrius CBS 109.77 TaxID=1314802 RepID=A0A6A6X006_9PLEO|nr:putative multidrug resistance ABC transporter [Melanomma pulvis-pyrius CBS 109.77]
MNDNSSARPGVSFHKLNVSGLRLADEYQRTAASCLLIIPKLFARLFRKQDSTRAHILHDFYGTLHHGEMLLVLGRPGSGCSTFLKVIAGETLGLHVSASSRILYDGMPHHRRGDSLKGTSIYLSEHDVHFPELTLGQTLEFAAATQKPSTVSLDTLRIGHDVATKFKLAAAYNSPVGNAMIRGISGGEKRRTSIAEVFISDCWLQCWDNSTRGLDSSTAHSFVQLLRSSKINTKATVMMSIYQASNSIYENFDKVMLLHEGYQIYFGPTELAVEHFFALGFEKPTRATTADFLTSITHPAERHIRKGYENRVPRSAREFADAWRQSDQAKLLLEEITSSGDDDDTNPKPQDNVYTLSTSSQINLCIHRGFQRLRNHYVPPLAGIIGNTIIAIVVGSVYYNLSEDTDGMDKRAVLIFFSLMINAYAPAFDVLAMWSQRPIVEKHHRYAFYRPFTESIASIICDLPNKLATAIMFNVPLYFMTNLRRSASAFFTYLLFMTVTILTMSMFFRTVGSLSKTLEQSMVPTSMVILIFSAYTGYIIPVKDMVPWLAWLRRLNPIAFAYESLMINEFADRTFPCVRIIPSGPTYSEDDMDGKICAVVGAAPGQIDLDGSTFIALKYSYHADHLWRNLGILFSMLIILCGVHLIATDFIPAQRSRGEILLYPRKSAKRTRLSKDEETGDPLGTPIASSQKGITIEGANIDAKEDTHFTSTVSQLHEDHDVFHWSKIDYSIQIKRTKRKILQDIEGWVRPGSLTALMGVTGAGKTSLLDTLAHRITTGTVEGDMRLGSVVPDANFQRKIGYVQQEDIHLPTTTVREALEFSARLRMPDDGTSNRLKQVLQTLDLLEMTEYADAVVGVPGEGLNVEQRKRLSIAVEMVAKPELLLFLDEPTSGLDSQTAWSICMLLRKLANSGQAIIITIHQPSSQLFELFDRLLLLDHHGKVAYFGDIGSDAETMIAYFERHGTEECGPVKNPAEWVLNVVSGDEDALSSPINEKTMWNEVWARSVEREEVLRQIAAFRASPARENDGTASSHKRNYASSFTTQLYVVARRAFQDYWRDPVYLYCKGALCVVTTLLNGLSFYNTSLSIQGITNIFFSVFLFTQLFSTIDQQVIPRLITGRALFEARERRSKSYSWAVFLAVNILVELFWQSVASVLVFLTWYYPTGLWRNHDVSFPATERGGLAFGMIWLFCAWISTFSQAVSVGIESAETAVQIATLFFWLSLVFCGVLVPPKDLPQFWHFVYRASPLTYFVDGMVVAGLANTEIRCSDVEMLHINPPAGTKCGDYLTVWTNMVGGYLKDPTALHDCEYCPISGTNILLKSTGINVGDRWHNFAYLMVYVAFNVVATFAIYWLARERRSRSSR